jgi:hypothetical protein
MRVIGYLLALVALDVDCVIASDGGNRIVFSSDSDSARSWTGKEVCWLANCVDRCKVRTDGNNHLHRGDIYMPHSNLAEGGRTYLERKYSCDIWDNIAKKFNEHWEFNRSVMELKKYWEDEGWRLVNDGLIPIRPVQLQLPNVEPLPVDAIWTQEDDDELRKFASVLDSLLEIQEMTRRSITSIMERMKFLGLESKDYLDIRWYAYNNTGIFYGWFFNASGKTN